MADEETTPDSTGNELDDFARSFMTDEPTPEAAPAAEPAAEVKPEEVKPAAEETKPATEETKPAEEVKPAAEEEENPFKVDENAEKPTPEPEIPEKPSSKDHWDTLRASRDRHKTASEEKEAILREKEAEIENLKAKAARAAELEEKLRVFDEQEKELAVTRIESTREYKETIEAPLFAIGEQVEILVKSNEGDVSEVRRMLIEADPAKQRTMLKEITSGWDEIDRIDLKKMAEDTRTLLDRQDNMRANAHAAAKEREQIASQKETEAKEISRKDFIKAAGDAVKSIREKVPFLPLAEGETEDDRYSVLAQKVAQVDFEAQTPRAKALAVASTLALPQAIKTIGLKDAEIASLKEALAKATSSKASVSPKADPTADEGEKDFFAEFGIKDPNSMFGSQSLNVTA